MTTPAWSHTSFSNARGTWSGALHGSILKLSGTVPLLHKEFEVFAVIMDWHTPFAIVILEHKRIVRADPGTSFGGHKLRPQVISRMLPLVE